MDTRTRHALKKDKFALAAASSASWVSVHRASVVRWSITAVVVLVALLGAWVFGDVESAAANSALGAAMDVYTAPLVTPETPAGTGVYSTAADRAKEANRQFLAVAQKYGWLSAGIKARYFAGVTYQEMGQNASAETELKTVANSSNRNLSNLAKLALANLYHQTGRDSQAIEIYNQLIAKPSVTVSAPVAQLDLADLYAAQGKRDQARALWAKVEDADKQGAAGSIAAQKLGPK